MLAGYAVDEPHWRSARGERYFLLTKIRMRGACLVFGLSVAVIKVAVSYEL
jgi:hypothetical protein